ncbi:TDP-N-acetylfucosamine:lipid II N-acetylfucosaminyltransferase [Shewanella baltica]|uniref:TDP-N-acetylfucosamine:lipid II N-acetylfucosaminyltransferase n=1 Tax=Shewanella baltica TaxID=62322 RepID=UPI0024B92A1E|nr:TDP-N-acetylfucosamine:lipid II N-acetylfucosaminyltransferase [Shewanella baltica]
MEKNIYHCPLCDYRGELLSFRGRLYAQCPHCLSLERHRFQCKILQKILHDKNTQLMHALHFAPEPGLKAFFGHRFGKYVTADIAMPDVDINVDIQALPFADETFDLVFASHVLEHIPDDRKALSEIRRVLKPKGMAILPVPIVAAATIEYIAPDPLQDNHVRAPGLDYYERYEDYFSSCIFYSSEEVDAECQPFVFIGESYQHPLRVDEHKMKDIIPVCYRQERGAMDKILHIFGDTHHHNVSIINYFTELDVYGVQHQFLVFDRGRNIGLYAGVSVDILFFSQNMDVFPWLRTHHHEFDEVFFHGFFNHVLWELILEDEAFCRKSNWLMFGGDLLMELYFKENDPLYVKTSEIRRKCVPKMHSIFSNISSKTDENICVNRYGRPKVCLKYAYYDNYDVELQQLPESLSVFLQTGHVVVIGNSADMTNRHQELITIVHEKWPESKILCPLTYSGNQKYIDEVVAHGSALLGDKFYPLLEMLPKAAYFYALSLCQALFLGHQRQQAGHNWLFWLKSGKPLFGVCSAPIPSNLIDLGAKIIDITEIPDAITFVNLEIEFARNHDVFERNFTKPHIDLLWQRNFAALHAMRQGKSALQLLREDVRK